MILSVSPFSSSSVMLEPQEDAVLKTSLFPNIREGDALYADGLFISLFSMKNHTVQDLLFSVVEGTQCDREIGTLCRKVDAYVKASHFSNEPHSVLFHFVIDPEPKVDLFLLSEKIRTLFIDHLSLLAPLELQNFPIATFPSIFWTTLEVQEESFLMLGKTAGQLLFNFSKDSTSFKILISDELPPEYDSYSKLE